MHGQQLLVEVVIRVIDPPRSPVNAATDVDSGSAACRWLSAISVANQVVSQRIDLAQVAHANRCDAPVGHLRGVSVDCLSTGQQTGWAFHLAQDLHNVTQARQMLDARH